MYVLINPGWSVALYCQRCGKIQLHDMSYFSKRDRIQTLRCSCNHAQATLMRTTSDQIKIQIPCGACDALHEAKFKKKKLLRLKLEKIYCYNDHFELGYIGKRKNIEDFLAYNKREFETINAFNSDERIDKQQILLEILNKVHDIASEGGVICPCSHPILEADIVGDTILLECQHCGRYYMIPARDEQDLKKINTMDQIELAPGKFIARN